MTGESVNKDKFKRENPFERMDVRFELDKLDERMEMLRLQYEQFFTGIIQFSPDKLHAEVKRSIRKLLKAPFRNSEMNFRLKSLEGRYHALHSYWQRILREREDGTYVKDVFKANMRERARLDEAQASTAQGAAQKAMKHLFANYRDALERNTGRVQNLDFEAFQKAILQRTREFKERNQGQRVSFKIVVQDGKVAIKASAKPAPSTESGST